MTETTVIEGLHPEFISISELICLIKIYGRHIDHSACAEILINSYYDVLDSQMVLTSNATTKAIEFVGYAGDEENHPQLKASIFEMIRKAYVERLEQAEKEIYLSCCYSVGFARKKILEKISDRGEDFYLDLPEHILIHAQSPSMRLDKTIPLESLLKVYDEQKRELLRLRRQKKPEPPRLETSNIPRQLSPLEQAKADVERGQQTPLQVAAKPKKTDPRELASYYKLISILLDLADLDTSQPYKAAGVIDSHARKKGFPSLCETKIADLIKASISIRNND